jgi:shikimate dehydrogenase
MHKSALLAISLAGDYLPFMVSPDNLKEALKGLFTLGFTGLNVTTPLKEKIIPHLTSLSEVAQQLGAVNTLIRTPDGFMGDNTDAPGFSLAYLDGLNPQTPTLLLGAGGAARAVAQALKTYGLPVTITSRNPKRAQNLALEFNLTNIPWEEIKNTEPFGLVVNATSASSPLELGSSPPVPNLVYKGQLIDINYGRKENYFAQLAKKNKASFFNGLLMLAYQARLSFSLWTGIHVPLNPFLKILDRLYCQTKREKN